MQVNCEFLSYYLTLSNEYHLVQQTKRDQIQ